MRYNLVGTAMKCCFTRFLKLALLRLLEMWPGREFHSTIALYSTACCLKLVSVFGIAYLPLIACLVGYEGASVSQFWHSAHLMQYFSIHPVNLCGEFLPCHNSVSFFDTTCDSLLNRDSCCFATLISVCMLCGFSPAGHFLCISLCLLQTTLKSLPTVPVCPLCCNWVLNQPVTIRAEGELSIQTSRNFKMINVFYKGKKWCF